MIRGILGNSGEQTFLCLLILLPAASPNNSYHESLLFVCSVQYEPHSQSYHQNGLASSVLSSFVLAISALP
jgi:hypothetical protein